MKIVRNARTRHPGLDPGSRGGVGAALWTGRLSVGGAEIQ